LPLPLPLPLRTFFAVYSCNRTEFSYVIFTEQRNFTTAERRNGNGRTAKEWWKPGITKWSDGVIDATNLTKIE